MNIETPTIVKSTQSADTKSSTTQSSQVSTADDGKTFKDELASVVTKETTDAEKAQAAEETAVATKADEAKTAEVSVQVSKDELAKITAQQAAKDKLAAANKKSDLAAVQSETDALLQPFEELKAKIEIIKNLKDGIQAPGRSSQLSEKLSSDKTLNMPAIKMSTDDAMFFVNLVKNEQFSLGQSQLSSGNNVAELKSEASQAPIQVSATLMNTLMEASKTNKPFRIDFDNNVAVIMKIDKQGRISAEFIPGDAAVENYLKNNIPALQQSFSDKGLAYNELTYRKQKQQQQQNNNNQQQHKENDDE